MMTTLKIHQPGFTQMCMREVCRCPGVFKTGQSGHWPLLLQILSLSRSQRPDMHGILAVQAGCLIRADTQLVCRCPGVFKTALSGCGLPLQPVVESFTLDGGQSRMAYWQCGNHECHFREFLHERLTKPQVALEAISAEEGFKVQPTSLVHRMTQSAHHMCKQLGSMCQSTTPADAQGKCCTCTHGVVCGAGRWR